MIHRILFLALAAMAAMVQADDINFNRDIRPILSDKCFYCHGPDSGHRQADLRLDMEADAKDYAIVEGMPEDSEFYSRITSEDADLRMPPVSSGKELDVRTGP